MSAKRTYNAVPKLDLSTRRYIVAELTPRACTLGLELGDVVEVGDSVSVIYRNSGYGPPRKLLDSMIVSGTLAALDVRAAA